MNEDRDQAVADKRRQARESIGVVCHGLNLGGTHDRIIRALDLDEALSGRAAAGQPVPLGLRAELAARKAATVLELIALLLALPVLLLMRAMR